MVCGLVSISLDSPQLVTYKNKLYKTLNYWSRDVLSFDFLEKGLRIVSLSHFVYDFSRKRFLCYNVLTDQIFTVGCPLLREILGNMRIAILCFAGYDVINFEISFLFLIKPFFYTTKGLFIWRWIGPVRRASSPRWDDFYPMFIWSLLSQFNQKVCYVAGKRLFGQVVFTINSDVKSLFRTNVFILFNESLGYPAPGPGPHIRPS